MIEKDNNAKSFELETQRLKTKFKEWGISTVAWDLDGTLVHTTSLFDQAMLDALRIMGIEEEQLQNKKMVFDSVVWGLRPEFGINPAVMEVSTVIMAKLLGIDPLSADAQSAITRIRKIYNHDIAPLRPNALEIVKTLDAAANQSILVTHSEESWAWRKIIGANLSGFFGRVFCLSIDRLKSEQWEKVIKEIGINPSSLLVIGDSLEADISKPVELGSRGIYIGAVEHKTYTKENGTDFSGLNNTGRVIQVSSLSEIIPKLLSVDSSDWKI